MPMHDWTRVIAGIFHHFHHSWIEELSRALNRGILPADYYALSEQLTGNIGPDVLTLTGPSEDAGNSLPSLETSASNGTVAVAQAPPRVQLIAQAEMDYYARTQSHLSIRHSSDDRVVALVEVVSPGNKGGQGHFPRFVDKAIDALLEGYHLLILDPLPPKRRDPNGVHGAIWNDIGDGSYQHPAEKPLTLAAYDAGPPVTAYVQPVAVGEVLAGMPLFLRPGHYVNVPLEETYQRAYESVPMRWRRVLEES